MRTFDDFTLPGFWQNPFPFYERSFTNAERIQASPGGGIAVLGYEAARAIGMHPAIDGTPLPGPVDSPQTALNTVLRHGVFAQISQEHKLYRRAALSGLNNASLKDFTSQAQTFVNARLAQAADQSIDLVNDICLPLAAECWAQFAGYGADEAASLSEDIKITGEQLSFEPDPSQVEASETAATSLLSRTTQAITRSPGCPLHRMSHALGQERGVPMATSLLFDAIDTTAAGLAGLLAILMQALDDFESLKDPALRDRAIEEALRLATPTPLTVRQAHEDVQVGEVCIPAGSWVWMWWAAANRDPEAFPEPERFLLDREKRAMPFGVGAHSCIGHGWTKQLAHILVESGLTGPRRLIPSSSDWSWKIGGARRPDRLKVRMS